MTVVGYFLGIAVGASLGYCVAMWHTVQKIGKAESERFRAEQDLFLHKTRCRILHGDKN